MPYELHIDHDLRLVSARVWGKFTEAEAVAYFNERVWTSAEARGYSELIDVTEVRLFSPQLIKSLPQFAESSARMDASGAIGGNLVIVAADDFLFGLGRMYQALREVQPDTRRKVGVFRTREEALAWLASVQASERGSSSASETESVSPKRPAGGRRSVRGQRKR
jgi:hypothetical protein